MSERTASTPPAGASPIPYIPGLDGVPAARSSICWIDGDQGVLEYRGYPIETLAEKSTFEETSYLLLWEKLPNRAELEKFSRDLRGNRDVRFRLIDLLKCLPDTGHPMEALQASIAALGMFYPDRDPMKTEDRYQSTVRLIAKTPTLVAAFHRLSLGKDYIPPLEELSHAANFLYMLTGEEPDADVARVMDICFILHAEHSMNASTFGGRVTASTLADPYTVISSAIGALTGPLHGGANEQVIHMLQQIGDAEKARSTIEDLIARKQKIMGIGHRIYRVKDPRALVLQKLQRSHSDRRRIGCRRAALAHGIANDGDGLADGVDRRVMPESSHAERSRWRAQHLIHRRKPRLTDRARFVHGPRSIAQQDLVLATALPTLPGERHVKAEARHIVLQRLERRQPLGT